MPKSKLSRLCQKKYFLLFSVTFILLLILYPQNLFADANDDPSGASELAIGTKYSSYIDPSGDIDWAKFYISASGEINILFEVPSGLDYDIELYNSSASVKLDGSYNGAGQDETIVYTASSSGWFYIKRYGYGGDYSSSEKYYTTVSYSPGNTCPTLDMTSPSSNQTVTQGQTVTISWNGTDPDDSAIVSIGYDQDSIYDNGNHTWLAVGQSEDGSLSWNTSGVSPGTYYIFGMIYDGECSDHDYASGTVTVLAPNICPTLDMTSPSSNQTVTQGQNVAIAWNGTDPDDAATVSIGYDQDNIFDNGNHTWIALSQSEDGSYSWNTSGVAPGTYYIFGMIYDGECSDHDYASGTVTVLAPNICPTLDMTSPSSNQTVTQGQNVAIAWNGTDPDDAATVSIGYDQDNIFDNGNHTWIALSQSEDGSYSWNTSGVAPGTYYIFGMIYDGECSDHDYASGTVTVLAPNICPTLDMTSPSSNQTVTQGQNVAIAWNGTDPDDAATVSIGYDQDNIFDNGNHTWIALSQSEDGSYSWNTSGVALGTYYIFGMIYDGECSDHDYASETVTLNEPDATPIASVTDISNQPSAMYPGVQYSVTAKYYDSNGAEDLHYCCLRLDHPTGNDLTMCWDENTGDSYPWAGEDGADYLTLDNVQTSQISESSAGYEVTWTFTINSNWQETESGIRFGVYAEDDSSLSDGWNHDNSSTSFEIQHSAGEQFIAEAKRIFEILDAKSITQGYNDGIKHLIFFSYDVNPAPLFTGNVMLVFDLDDLLQITQEGQEGWVTYWVDVQIGISQGTTDLGAEVNAGFIPVSRESLTVDDPKRTGQVEILGGGVAGGKWSLITVNEDGIQNGSLDWAPDLNLGSLTVLETTWNLLKGELSRDLVLTAISAAFPAGSPSTITNFSPISNSIVSYLFSIQEILATASLQPDILHRSFTSSDAPGPTDPNSLMFTGARGGVDVNGDIWEDNYVPTSTPNINRPSIYYPLRVSLKSDDYQEKRLSVKVSGVPSGWEIEAIDSNNNPVGPQYGPFDADPNTSYGTIWHIGTISGAQQDIAVSFELWEDNVILPDKLIDTVIVKFSNQNQTWPQTPTAIEPLDEEIITTLLPTFEWTAFQDGGDIETQNGYQIRVRCDDDSDVIVYDTGFIPNTTDRTHVYNPEAYVGTDPVTGNTMISNPLEWGKHYHWHVRYRDSGGDWSAWSADVPDSHQDFYTDIDSDGDGIPDSNDGCDDDPNKTAPGICGCGTPDTDSDGDNTPDCNDLCDSDPNKIDPGICGCGTPDTDSDGDNTPDCNDLCDDDPNKTAPGICGCGTPDTDSDGDNTPDCNDLCDDDPNKAAPGICGCGTPDTDSDGDNTPDCNDLCDSDPNKTAPGICGCGTPDTDSDGDNTPDCNDLCDDDPNKTAPGICGCGTPDTDSDGDGTPDCNDDDLMGDISGNQIVDMEDAILALKIIAGYNPAGIIFEADVDGDGKIGIAEVVYILQEIAGYRTQASGSVDFFWQVYEWGTCSADCGGGFQTRTVVCVDSLGNVVTDNYCTEIKPYTEQVCNTFDCVTSCTSNSDCFAGEYCEFPVGTCSGQGKCADRPDVCIQIYDPVCGCNGVTYSNAGCAAVDGVSVAFSGTCILPN